MTPEREARRLAQRAKQKAYARGARLQRQYGLTLAAYDAMVSAQGGACAICRKAPTGRSLMIDHDHQTGRVRALLCNRCNTFVGYVEKTPDMIPGIRAYIAAHKEPPS